MGQGGGGCGWGPGGVWGRAEREETPGLIAWGGGGVGWGRARLVMAGWGWRWGWARCGWGGGSW